METQDVELVYRYCPRCGTQSDDLGSIPFRCHQCQLVRYFGPVAAVGGLILDDERNLLVVRRANDPGKGKWGLPGGFVDNGETMEAALHREVHEETKLELVSFEYLVSYPNRYRYGGIEADVVDLFFSCKVAHDAKPVLDATELTECRWVSLLDAPQLDFAFPSNQSAVELLSRR